MQGVISEVPGGSFKSGFFGAALGYYAGRKLKGWFPTGEASAGALAGHTMVVVITGRTVAAFGK